MLQRGATNQAVQLYQESCKDRHDSELVQNIALAILKEGFQTRKPETQLISLFGAGISLNEKLLGLLEQGLNSSVPELQLISLNFLSRFQNDLADELMNKAMASDYLEVRLEAAFHLAGKKNPTVVSQLEALLHKVPYQIHPIFPQLFAMVGNADAIKNLKKMLASPYDDVRIEAIRSVAEYGRDDLITKVRTLATHHKSVQQEVAAYALGIMKDESSAPHLQRLAKSQTPSIRLAALKALYDLGRNEVSYEIEKEANSLNLFAITLLGQIAGSEEVLVELTKHNQLQVRLNASLALLEHRDPRCLRTLCEVLVRDSRDLALTKQTSVGRTLSSYKIIASAKEHFKDQSVSSEVSLSLKETALIKAFSLPEKEFLNLACTLFDNLQNDLVPALVHLLEELKTPDAVRVLKTYQQKAGAPLIRNYCNLALYRLKEDGPYFDNLKKWLVHEQNQELIRFRPIVPRNSLESSIFQLNPEETSRLLIEAYEAVTMMQEKESIDILLKAIREGNPNNKFALAGLLIRAAQ